ncbi:hypothetical protein QEZ54_34490 [Catellatospora sp. KI3]|uniref:hypothetical protein n=1 Tax=Catellatospora sp. KI3 TaxID=3041620 RepID=UPI002482491A|nr:hypothetical protein [Catellatospora sp. KI3]MDI1466096.1 hypothetical protein [Catellatospora sp. KI3]
MFPTNLVRAVRRALSVLLTTSLVAAVGIAATADPAAAAADYFSFDAGIVQPGAVRHVYWNNATSDAYAVGLEVATTRSGRACAVEVTRTWYEREATGEREFHLQLTGDSSTACQVRVWLAGLTMYRRNVLPALAPGASWSGHWNNAHSEDWAYLVGAVGSVPGSGSCRIEVKTHYRTQPDGESEFYYTATNVGVQTCSAELRHVELPVDHRPVLWERDPGETASISTGLPDGVRMFVHGARPNAVPGGPCRYSIGPPRYMDGGGVFVDYSNDGAVTCATMTTWTEL